MTFTKNFQSNYQPTINIVLNNNKSIVEDIQIIEGKGPWVTKSAAELRVLFSIPTEDLQQKFFTYDKKELDRIGSDIRGLRSYVVENIPKNSIGANEWHKLRHEIVLCRKGKVLWSFEDLGGNKKEVVIKPGICLWIPPYILHTYKALEDDTVIQVIANTLFIPDNPSTHDTFSAENFK